MVPLFEQNEQLQRTPPVKGSASNENLIAPQWQLPWYACIQPLLKAFKKFLRVAHLDGAKKRRERRQDEARKDEEAEFTQK